MTVFAVALSKGGSTKTTTAAEVVVALTQRGRRVLAVDLDQQGNFSTRLGVTAETEVEGVAADVLLGSMSARKAATPAPSVAGCDVLVGTHDLANIDAMPELLTALRDDLPHLRGQWDDVVIDTPPASTLATLSALAAAEVVVASMACEVEAFDQVNRLAEVIERRIAPRLNPGCRVDWIVPTRYDGRRRLDRELVAALRRTWTGRVTPTVREAVAARDAYTAGLPVSLYAAGEPIAQDYGHVTDTILGARA